MQSGSSDPYISTAIVHTKTSGQHAAPARSTASDSAALKQEPVAGEPIPRASRVARQRDVAQLRQRVYGDTDLSAYGPRDRVRIRAGEILFWILIRLVCATLRWDVRGGEHLDAILASGHRAIFTFWHTCIFGATWFWRRRGIVVMSSRSRDGEFTGRLIKRFGYGAARGSSTRGAGRALAEMAECLASGIDVAFTIDGPRGPAYVAKAGAVTLARHSGQAILPFHIAVSRSIRLGSWDRQQIPLPFARAIALVGEPIYVPRDGSGEDVAAKQAALQACLDHLRKEASELGYRT